MKTCRRKSQGPCIFPLWGELPRKPVINRPWLTGRGKEQRKSEGLELDPWLPNKEQKLLTLHQESPHSIWALQVVASCSHFFWEGPASGAWNCKSMCDSHKSCDCLICFVFEPVPPSHITWSMVLIHPHWVRVETSGSGVVSSLDYLTCYALIPKLNSEEKFTVSES